MIDVNSSVNRAALQQLSDDEFRALYNRAFDNRSYTDPYCRAMTDEYVRRQALGKTDLE